MPHTLAASPCPVKRAPRCDRMPRFCVCLARMCHFLPKDDPRYLLGAAWLLEASRGSNSTLALPGLAVEQFIHRAFLPLPFPGERRQPFTSQLVDHRLQAHSTGAHLMPPVHQRGFVGSGWLLR